MEETSRFALCRALLAPANPTSARAIPAPISKMLRIQWIHYWHALSDSAVKGGSLLVAVYLHSH